MMIFIPEELVTILTIALVLIGGALFLNQILECFTWKARRREVKALTLISAQLNAANDLAFRKWQQENPPPGKEERQLR